MDGYSCFSTVTLHAVCTFGFRGLCNPILIRIRAETNLSFHPPSILLQFLIEPYLRSAQARSGSIMFRTTPTSSEIYQTINPHLRFKIRETVSANMILLYISTMMLFQHLEVFFADLRISRGELMSFCVKTRISIMYSVQ